MLTEEFCDRFWKTHEPREDYDDYEAGDRCQGATTHLAIHHPGICPLVWNRCVLTKFSGTISSQDMGRDMRFGWGPFRAYRQHFHTGQGAVSLPWFYLSA